MKPRQEQALKTKEALFNSAITLFAEKGYMHVSVDEIVAKAGTSKGSFYTHFKSKDEIILEKFKKVDKIYPRIYKKIKRFSSASDQLLHFCTETLKYVNKNMGLDITKVVYNSQLFYSAEKTYVIDESRELYTIIRNIIDYGQSVGEFTDAITPVDLTKMTIRSLRGTLYEWCLYDGEFNLVKSGERFLSVFIKGIAK